MDPIDPDPDSNLQHWLPTGRKFGRINEKFKRRAVSRRKSGQIFFNKAEQISTLILVHIIGLIIEIK
jgi:hypothetical protein